MLEFAEGVVYTLGRKLRVRHTGGLTRHQGYGRYPRRPFSCRRDSTVFPVVAFVTHVHVQVHVAVISYTHTYARTKKITTDFFVIIMH